MIPQIKFQGRSRQFHHSFHPEASAQFEVAVAQQMSAMNRLNGTNLRTQQANAQVLPPVLFKLSSA